MDDALGLLAIVNIDAGHVDLDIARSNDDAMIIESLMGLILTVSGGNSESSIDPAQMVIVNRL